MMPMVAAVRGLTLYTTGVCLGRDPSVRAVDAMLVVVAAWWVLTRSLTGLAGCLVTDLSVLACRHDAVVAVVAAV